MRGDYTIAGTTSQACKASKRGAAALPKHNDGRSVLGYLLAARMEGEALSITSTPLRLVFDTAAVQMQEAGTCGPACEVTDRSVTQFIRPISDDHAGDGRDRGSDGHASVRGSRDGHGDSSDDHGCSGGGSIRRPARRAGPRPPAVNNGLVTPQRGRGDQKSPAEVAATEGQCER